jgi:intracellular proteinase inhibitor BsuPI
MRRIGKTVMPLLCGVMLLSLGACDGHSPTEPGPGRLKLSVALSSTSIAAGEQVTMTFTVLNEGGSPVELTFGDSCRADLSVASGGVVVWNALAGAFCLQQVTTSSLSPGQSLVFQEVWDQSRNTGGRVGPGTYSVFGTLRASEQPSSPEATLTIR